MNRRFLLWLRAFTDRRLYREQLMVTLSVNGKAMVHIGSLEAHMLVKFNGGIWSTHFQVHDIPVTLHMTVEPVIR